MKITFIGGGNMATALIGGMKKQGFSAAGIQVVEPFIDARELITESFGVRSVAAVDAAALNCDVLVLAVKPQQMKAAVAPLAGKLTHQVVLSIAAGLRVADMAAWLGYGKIVRAMPNTPALIGAGITGLFADPSVDAEERRQAEKILQAVGVSVWVDDEAQMDVVTAISGSGPAYVFYFIEAIESVARTLGLDAESARQLTVQTFLGAAQLAAKSSERIATLRERVTSKGGTTEAALQAFAAQGVAAAIAQGVMAANARGRELGETLGRQGAGKSNS
ncbi:pyrroline-5-carboxylate reductase [Rugosibacter aromaticivorans]|uniref:Pyrroline-5-carboxylate reductase n=1 Tax=Rugosibacter aromaticivorans TaxID=1565605 RepID=A0A0C5J273_9PROT|nr:pyrroline-5-carboxylate reductase [Rugosibacter aromaticivorans]AJP49137.1 pyrroline-5-carboxylate reductase [Rugosibacter aromaticivorans]TBR15502.1 MAG: pyrroline-5-carboxylate reductase [Rugosibacter sp.]